MRKWSLYIGGHYIHVVFIYAWSIYTWSLYIHDLYIHLVFIYRWTLYIGGLYIYMISLYMWSLEKVISACCSYSSNGVNAALYVIQLLHQASVDVKLEVSKQVSGCRKWSTVIPAI